MNRQSQETTNIEALEKILGSLRITEEYTSDRNKTIELALSEEILTTYTPVVYNEIVQAVMPKSMVPNLG